LVEKAAERLEGGILRGDAASTGPLPAEGPSSPPMVEEKNAAPPQPATPPAETPVQAQEREPEASQAQTDTRRTKRQVEIDFERLSRAGFVTPQRMRTRIAEEYRVIKRPMLQKAFARGANAIPNGHLILVTSSRPGEGKTFTSINLAMSIASERDLTVLLVDADFAKQGVMNTLNLTAERGLSNMLTDDTLDLSDVMIRTSLPNLSILPAGPASPLTTELLASDRMGRLIEDIAARYPDRVIIFDSPPVLASSEPAVLATHVGQVLFVVEADETGESAVREALDLISSCKNIGLVLNKTQSRIGSELFGSYYYYGEGRS
jgi:receptor protein-tyrosine kinase